MTRFTPAVAFVIAAVAVASAQPADELKGAAGKWTVTKATLGGKDFTKAFKGVELVLAADGAYTLTVGGESDKGTVKVDAAKTPKEMDIIGMEGPNAGKTFRTIYKHDGNAMTVCYELGDGPRPTAFESKAGTKVFLAVYKRAK
ncbi:MAG TPA: TIGR03067 domain-containing protein [Urbifossiella sp.]|nr:TIGR03067 domain-containing protein [Urbifossiella sp.]